MDMSGFEKMSPKEFGRYMRYYRMKAGVTARAAGELIGKSQASVYQVESGKSGLGAGDMVRLLGLYGVSLDDAFSEPWDVVDNPSRAKSAGSMRSMELQEIFAKLPEKEQSLVLNVAKTALKSVEPRTE